jgi:peptide/nickel transport system substrate-binding protein
MVLAGYRLEARVAAGGMGLVFRARDVRLGRLVALKVLAPALAADPAFRRRFIAESRAAASVDDPHIIPLYEADEADGVLFIAMRFVPGGDLRQVLDREGALAARRAAEFISPVASALDAAHAAGLVHRDVKPGNILVDTRAGRPDHVYLSDFGASKGALTSVSLTQPGHFLGTPDYAAPEQVNGLAVDGRADQYALACVTYQLLTGGLPFARDHGMAVLLAHLSAPPPSLTALRPDLPAAADQVLARGMAKNPDERFVSCGAFADALREALGLALYSPATSGAALAQVPLPATPESDAPVTQGAVSDKHDTVTVGSPAGLGRDPRALPAASVPTGASAVIHLGSEKPVELSVGRSIWRRWGIPASAAAAVVALTAVTVTINALSGPSHGLNTSASRTPKTGPSGAPSTATAATFNAALTGVVDPSARAGGTLAFGLDGTPDSTDPGNTYLEYMWNFSRLYTMPLMTYKSCPGACGLQVVPDLATGPGIVSDNGLTWTYHIQPNVEFEDGTTVTSQDVKYAVERTFDRNVLPDGPYYFPGLLGGNAATYPGPYKDPSKNLMGLTAIDTPDATTVVFHLAKPFADFNYLAALPQTAPVPPNKDTGANYQLHPISTGPYMFQSYQPNKQLTLVPNPYWKAATDPNAKQLASKITVTMNMSPDDIDNQLLAGDLSMDMTGAGVQATTGAKILSSGSLKAQADNPFTEYARFAYLNTKVPPLDNIHCRMAIEYATSKINQQAAYGGPYAGAIATAVAPPNLTGQRPFDLYEATTEPDGDITKAKAELAACGHAGGFTARIAYRSDRPLETAAADALQASLARAGIKATLHGYPIGSYYTSYAGVPAYTDQQHLGILLGTWSPDWPDGYSMLDAIADGDAISPTGNVNIAQLNDPVINNLLAKMKTTLDPATRNGYSSQIDMQIMKDAAILPGVWPKLLLYRNPSLTNVYVQASYGQYNYAVLGVK